MSGLAASPRAPPPPPLPQIELYSHVPVFPAITRQLKFWDFNLCAVYLLDAHFAVDVSKVRGAMSRGAIEGLGDSWIVAAATLNVFWPSYLGMFFVA